MADKFSGDLKHEVIRDNQEKKGYWTFENTVSEHLKTGDYTLRGFENLITIERKASTGEVSQNMYEERFEKELIRLEEFRHPFMICEFTLDDVHCFPATSGIPRKIWHKIKMTSKQMLSTLCRYQIQYKTKIILAGTDGKQVAESLFKNFLRYNESLIKDNRKPK